MIEECIAVAAQALNAGNRQLLHFVVVTDRDKRASLAGVYRRCSASYFSSPRAAAEIGSGDPVRDEAMKRKSNSELYLNNHLHEVPIHVIPCISGCTDHLDVLVQAARWGSMFPAAWSFMFAGRGRGLGMTFTTIHLHREEETASLLGIPFKEVMQAGVPPVGYTKGSRFRQELEAVGLQTDSLGRLVATYLARTPLHLAAFRCILRLRASADTCGSAPSPCSRTTT